MAVAQRLFDVCEAVYGRKAQERDKAQKLAATLRPPASGAQKTAPALSRLRGRYIGSDAFAVPVTEAEFKQGSETIIRTDNLSGGRCLHLMYLNSRLVEVIEYPADFSKEPNHEPS